MMCEIKAKQIQPKTDGCFCLNVELQKKKYLFEFVLVLVLEHIVYSEANHKIKGWKFLLTSTDKRHLQTTKQSQSLDAVSRKG